MLFPEIEPFHRGFLQVSPLHKIYYEQCGNPKGKTAVFLHGGPGGGISPYCRRFFDPKKWHLVLFDQRGAGQSTPFAETRENTTPDLVSDIEKLRKHLNISTWSVFGGSWGSTLALAYAQAHATYVSEMILRGIFLLRSEEIKWFYQEGAHNIFPDAFEIFKNAIPTAEQSNLLEAYYKRIHSLDTAEQLKYAKIWTEWEGKTSKLIFDEQAFKRFTDNQFALAFAKIETHYFYHKGFFNTDGELLQNICKIKHIPSIIVQGRYDIPCPMKTAWDLHKAWPEAKFVVVPNAGHSMNEEDIARELVKATETFSKGI